MNKFFHIFVLTLAMAIAMPTMAQDLLDAELPELPSDVELPSVTTSDSGKLDETVEETTEETDAKGKKSKKAKKEKVKKEKVPYVWDWDGTLSGNETFDDYLLNLDTIWNNIQEYQNMFGKYTYKQDTVMINEKYYIMAYMTDSLGNKVTRGRTNWQIANSILASTNIVLDATLASVLTATAALALPSLGMNAFFFGKYMKAGPMIIAKGMKEIGNVAKLNKQISRQWKAAKEGALDPVELGFSEKAARNMNKVCYIKEIVETDPSWQTVSTQTNLKSSDDLEVAWSDDSTTLPEEADKSYEDIDEVELPDELPEDLA